MKKNFSRRSRASFGAFPQAHQYNVTTGSSKFSHRHQRHHYLRYPRNSKSSLGLKARLVPRTCLVWGSARNRLPERMRLRVERQTLRRLPRSGAIVFTIRVYMTPLAELGPGEAGRLAAAIRGVREQEVVYRCVCGSSRLVCSCELRLTIFCACMCIRHRRQSDFEDAALEWLDGQHRDEMQRGLADQE